MTSFDQLAARLRALPQRTADLLVVAVVALFTGPDAAANEPPYRALGA
ncbi:hypothetical protein [Streptomyces sp. NPDC056468]